MTISQIIIQATKAISNPKPNGMMVTGHTVKVIFAHSFTHTAVHIHKLI